MSEQLENNGPGNVEDGYGSSWRRYHANCGLHVVRPGKAGCNCDHLQSALKGIGKKLGYVVGPVKEDGDHVTIHKADLANLLDKIYEML